MILGLNIGQIFLYLTLALFFMSALKILRMGVRHGGLLSRIHGAPPEFERVITLIGTLVAAFAYILKCSSVGPVPSYALPEPDEWSLWFAGGGQFMYLAGKAKRQN